MYVAQDHQFRGLKHLILCGLIVWLGCLWINPDALAANHPKVTVAIAGIRSQEVYAEDLERIYRTLLNTWKKYPEFSVIESQSWKDRFEANSNDHLLFQKGVSLLEQGKEAYQKNEFDKTIGLLDEAQKVLGQQCETTSKELKTLFLHQGLAYKGKGNEELSNASFESFIRIAPDMALENEGIPPDLLESVEKIRSQVINLPKGTLVIESDPKSQVFINGTLKGEAPLRLENQPIGPLFVCLSKEGHQTVTRQIEVTQTEQTLSEKLIAPLSAQTFQNMLQALHEKKAESKHELATLFGNTIQADIIVFGDVTVPGQHYNINLYFEDLRKRQPGSEVEGRVAIDLNDVDNRITQLSGQIRNFVLKPQTENKTSQPSGSNSEQQNKEWPDDRIFLEKIEIKKEPAHRRFCLF